MEPEEVTDRILQLQQVWPTNFPQHARQHMLDGVLTVSTHMGGTVNEIAGDFLEIIDAEDKARQMVRNRRRKVVTCGLN